MGPALAGSDLIGSRFDLIGSIFDLIGSIFDLIVSRFMIVSYFCNIRIYNSAVI
jgi:hypothetical protein